MVDVLTSFSCPSALRTHLTFQIRRSHLRPSTYQWRQLLGW